MDLCSKYFINFRESAVWYPPQCLVHNISTDFEEGQTDVSLFCKNVGHGLLGIRKGNDPQIKIWIFSLQMMVDMGRVHEGGAVYESNMSIE